MGFGRVVERRVRDRRGCTRPESVFERITRDYRGGASPQVDIRIGGRQLVHFSHEM